MRDLPIIVVLRGLDPDRLGRRAEDHLQVAQAPGRVILQTEGYLLHLLLDRDALRHPVPPHAPARGVRRTGVAVEPNLRDVIGLHLEAPVGDEPPVLQHGQLVVNREYVAVLVTRTRPAVLRVQELVQVRQRVHFALVSHLDEARPLVLSQTRRARQETLLPTLEKGSLSLRFLLLLREVVDVQLLHVLLRLRRTEVLQVGVRLVVVKLLDVDVPVLLLLRYFYAHYVKF